MISSYVRFSYKMSGQQHSISCLAFLLLHTVCPCQIFIRGKGPFSVIAYLAFNPLKIQKRILCRVKCKASLLA